ncbi:MAG TPA: GxxExxY protein [Gemmatimonadaceae bacterium]|nr:GxxExxY protein [Gemmatimonadaceae bacterium]
MRREDLNYITGEVVDAGIKVHSMLGPGLLETVYRACLAQELRLRQHVVTTEVPLKVVYKGVDVGEGYRIDLLVNSAVVVEVKAVERVIPVHEAQLLSHLRLGNYRVGLLMNFHIKHLKHGITRLVNTF